MRAGAIAGGGRSRERMDGRGFADSRIRGFARGGGRRDVTDE
jgi:hypothetical protein